MKWTITIVSLAVLMTLTTAQGEYSMQDYQILSKIQQLDSSETGHYLIDLLQMESMAQGDGVENIRAALLQLRKSLTTGISQEQAAYKTVSTACNSLISGLNTQIPLYQDVIQDSKKRQLQAQSALEEAQRNLDDTTRQITSGQSRLESGEKAQKEEVAAAEKKINEIKEAILALELAIKLVRRSRSTEFDFAELDKHMNKIFSVGVERLSSNDEVFSSVAEEIKTTRMALVQTDMMDYDEKRLEMIELLNRLADMFRKALLDDQNLENKNKEQWKKLKSDLKAELKTLTSNVEHLNDRIQKAKDQVKDANQTIIRNNELLTSAKKQLAESEKTCKTETDKFNAGEKTQNDDLAVVNELLNYINTQGATIKKYLESRAK